MNQIKESVYSLIAIDYMDEYYNNIVHFVFNL